MHRLSVTDAWILLAIYRAGQGDAAGYAPIISALPVIDKPFPAHEEFIVAYNKFLYINFILVDGDKTSISSDAKRLIENAKPGSVIGSEQDWVEGVYNSLSVYKLKSMCNRHEWKEDQYLRGLELLAETTRR